MENSNLSEVFDKEFVGLNVVDVSEFLVQLFQAKLYLGRVSLFSARNLIA